jgi:hypothetical protein
MYTESSTILVGDFFYHIQDQQIDYTDNLTPKGYFSLFLSSNLRVRWVELYFKRVQPIFHTKNNESIL